MVNVVVGFQDLERRQIPAESLMRMLGPKGSTSAGNLLQHAHSTAKNDGVRFELSLKP